MLRTAIVIGLSLVAGLECPLTAAQPTPWKCNTPPIEACVKKHGRLSSQNGIPFAIWIIGTTRRVGVDNSESLPAMLESYLLMTGPDHSYVYGDYDICPIEPDTPGHLRWVCVAGGEKLVVQPHDGRPSFRLASTWPRQ